MQVLDKYDFSAALIDLPHIVVFVLLDGLLDVIVSVSQCRTPLDGVSHRHLSRIGFSADVANQLKHFVGSGLRSLTRV
jgi:hypothetical protein